MGRGKEESSLAISNPSVHFKVGYGALRIDYTLCRGSLGEMSFHGVSFECIRPVSVTLRVELRPWKQEVRDLVDVHRYSNLVRRWRPKETMSPSGGCIPGEVALGLVVRVSVEPNSRKVYRLGAAANCSLWM